MVLHTSIIGNPLTCVGNGNNVDANTPQLFSVADAEKAISDKISLLIGCASEDNESSITQNLTLTETGANSSSITWISSIGFQTRNSIAITIANPPYQAEEPSFKVI